MASLISLPTSQPPVSSATFQVRPQSSRSIFVTAEKNARVPPHGSPATPLYSVLSVTGRVTPWIVRSPWRFQSSSSTCSNEVDVKAISGYASTSRKSGDLRCWSRCSTPVSMVAVAIVTRAVGLRGVLADHERALGAAEVTLDLGDHEVPGLEVDAGVRRVQSPGPGRRELDAVVGAGGGFDYGRHVSASCVGRKVSSRLN